MKGKLLVVTGLSGSGKDSVVDKFLIQKSSFRRLITCADRKPRKGEKHGVHYYFVSEAEMDMMFAQGELVEKPLKYGTSRKATPKKEFRKIIEENAQLVWRIESSLAAQVATGKFFDDQFEAKDGRLLKSLTTVVFITARKEDVEARRRSRDGSKYNPEDYKIRDEQDAEIVRKYGHLFKNTLENSEGELDKTVESVIKLVGLDF